MDKVFLHQLSWKEVKDYLDNNDFIIIPVGSIEQHGEHLPLGTDTLVAEGLAEAVARKTGVLVGPSISCGWSPHHMVLSGTVSIRAEVLTEYSYDIIASLAKHGFQRFLMLNGHRIVNIPWLQIAAERAKRQLDVSVWVADPAYLSREYSSEQGFELVGHADEIETSHMLYIHAELVDLQKAKDFNHKRKPYLQVDPRAPGDILCYVPSSEKEMQTSVEEAGGTSGSPTRSTVEKGKGYHEWIVANLEKIIGDLKSI